MKIGIAVDGQAECIAWRVFINKLRQCGHAILDPVYADVQPKATAATIARAAIPKLSLLRQQEACRFILLIDFEDKNGCPSKHSKDIEAAFKSLSWNVSVVTKVKCFENWLIADIEAIKKLPKRFKVTTSVERTVTPNKADNIANAQEMLSQLSLGEYHKRKDPVQLAKHLDPLRMAANSRSFRRLLRLIGHSAYSSQSRLPAIEQVRRKESTR